MGKTDAHNICTGAKVDEGVRSVTVAKDASPSVNWGTRHTDFEHKLGEEKWDQGPFVNIHLIKILFFLVFLMLCFDDFQSFCF